MLIFKNNKKACGITVLNKPWFSIPLSHFCQFQAEKLRAKIHGLPSFHLHFSEYVKSKTYCNIIMLLILAQ